ncbi:peptidase S8/S53 domain-containing protein [Scenedesmus sp. NREL 46B-D3]|nr:peptidase S8/S53 domain-containing protein [Scenedesmus sp. NREL 46B-D3]
MPGQGNSSSSGSSSLCSVQASDGGSWALPAVSAGSSGLPTKSEQVLLCLISSGVATSSPYLAQRAGSWNGCVAQHPLDPGGCALRWNSPEDNKGNWKQRGTFLASMLAGSGAGRGLDARVRGLLPDGADVYVVPVNTDTGSLTSSPDAAGGSSRIRAYTACEGHLRGLQALDYGLYAAPLRWRMVVLVDVAGKGPTSPVGSGVFKLSEAEWLAAATGPTVDGGAPDVLLVAPAGDKSSSVAFPGAFPQVLAVGGYDCEGRPLRSSYSRGSKKQPDILAPGKNIIVPSVLKDGSSLAATKSWEGSAAAAALAAGAAARLWSAFPGCGADMVRAALLSSTPLGSSQPARLNLAAARQFLVDRKC